MPAVLIKQLLLLAERYGLVTDDTSLILVKQRAEGERAADMPGLRKVKSMLAAGWGGQGATTMSKKAQPAVLYSMTRDSSVGQAVPSVWRIGRQNQNAAAFSDAAVESTDHEIPAILRRSDDPKKNSSN